MAAKDDRRGAADELHQLDKGDRPTLTTNQGIPVSDNQNSLRANAAGRRCSRTSSCARRSRTSTTSASPSASCTPAARARTASSSSPSRSTQYTTAKILTEVGEQTPVFARFSTVAGGAGSVDTPRDVRGFAVKFYTKEGNWDLVGNNIPVFFIQDAIKFPDLIHAVKMEPDRGFPQSATAHDTFWDFISLTPESMHMVMWIMSDRTIPRSLRMIEGFGVHSFRLVNADGRVDLRQVPLAAEARAAVHRVGRGGQDRRRRPGLPPPRPVRGDRERRLPGVGVRRPALHPGGGRRVPLRPPRRDQADPRGAGAAEGHRPHGARPLARQLLRRDRAGRLLPGEHRARHRLLQRPAAAGPAVLLPRHAALAARVAQLPPAPDQRAEVPVRQPPARRAHADDAAQGPRRLRAELAGRGLAARGGGGRLRLRAGHARPARRRASAPRPSPTTTARRGCSTSARSPPEQAHLASALVFELSKVEHLHIREAMVGHLRHIDEDLAKRVADGLALAPLPKAPPAAAPVLDLEPSPALQIIGKMKDTLEGRQVGILIADGSDGDAVEALRQAATEAGATVKIVAPKVGGATLADGTLLAADGQLAGTPSVFFDAVAVVLSARGRGAARRRERGARLRARRLRPPQGDRRGRRRPDAADRRRRRAGRRRGRGDGRDGLHRRGQDAAVGARAEGAHPCVTRGDDVL